ncbi:Carboxypeptidase regulatory-like domain protein [uncultured archaeon]|nr:Carboxypeptidase regulatory-like domain protein [uncultured archaeon]
MVGVIIKSILLFIILFLPSVAAGQLDENTDTIGNISIIVNDLKGSPIPDAFIQATDPSGKLVFSKTDSKGTAYFENIRKSNFIVKAQGYQDWVAREPIGPGVLMMVLVSEPANTNFHIIDTKRNDVPDAFIIIVDSMGNQVVKQSDAKGKASASVSPGRANITIKAGGYEIFNENSVNMSGNAVNTFVLEPGVNPKTSLLYIFALMVPFILLLIASMLKDTHHNKWYPFTSVAGWIIAFTILIFLAYYNNDYNIYFLDPMLKVSLFVPIAAFLGATSHITMSKLNNLERKLSQEEWRIVYVGYGRRLLMAPYIAVIALFTITEVAQVGNPWAVLFFAYFVGLYTKQIEGTLEEIGKKFLTEKQKNEVMEKDMKTLEIIRWLGVSTGIAARLKDAGIKDIDDLVAIKNIEEEMEKAGIDKDYVIVLKEKAKKLYEMGITHQKITILEDEEINSMRDLIQTGEERHSQIAEKYGINKTMLENFINQTK